MTSPLPFVRRSVGIGGRRFVIETVEDQDALLAASEGRGQFPFGLMLWESAIALGEALCERPELAAGRSVLELGAGLGLTGVIAASLGARVTQTDHDSAALAACARTALLNEVGDIVRLAGDWHDWRIPGTFDLILGADVTYDGADHGALLAVLAKALAPGGVAMLADPGREQQAAFASGAKNSGWLVQSSLRHVDDLKPAKPGARRAVTILVLRAW